MKQARLMRAMPPQNTRADDAHRQRRPQSRPHPIDPPACPGPTNQLGPERTRGVCTGARQWRFKPRQNSKKRGIDQWRERLRCRPRREYEYQGDKQEGAHHLAHNGRKKRQTADRHRSTPAITRTNTAPRQQQGRADRAAHQLCCHVATGIPARAACPPTKKRRSWQGLYVHR